jgi:tetratricopeptide (TPR) repeat protein
MKPHIGRLARYLPLNFSKVRMLGCLLVPCLLLGLGAAQADEQEAVADTAKVRFARGIALAETGDYQGALEAFTDAYSASPHVAVLYNIGQAQVALGRPLEAVATLSRYLGEGQDAVPVERRRHVEEQIKLLQSFLVDLDLSAVPANLAISVDGHAVGQTPLAGPVRLTAGTHKITAALDQAAQTETSAPRCAAVAPSNESEAGKKIADLDRSVGPPAPGSTGARRGAAYALIGAGVSLGASALGVYLWKRGEYERWQTEDSALRREVPGSSGYQARVEENGRRAASLTTANHTMVGLAIASGALLAVGGSLYLVDWVSARKASRLSVAWAGGSSVAAEWRYAW